MHKRCSDTKGRLKQDDDFRCQTCPSQETETTAKSPDTKPNCISLEVVFKHCYLGDTIGPGKG